MRKWENMSGLLQLMQSNVQNLRDLHRNASKYKLDALEQFNVLLHNIEMARNDVIKDYDEFLSVLEREIQLINGDVGTSEENKV